jgi:hypothetical protein
MRWNVPASQDMFGSEWRSMEWWGCLCVLRVRSRHGIGLLSLGQGLSSERRRTVPHDERRLPELSPAGIVQNELFCNSGGLQSRRVTKAKRLADARLRSNCPPRRGPMAVHPNGFPWSPVPREIACQHAHGR